jgi:hypothetical protein
MELLMDIVWLAGFVVMFAGIIGVLAGCARLMGGRE